jgi:hypothetical protein
MGVFRLAFLVRFLSKPAPHSWKGVTVIGMLDKKENAS